MSNSSIPRVELPASQVRFGRARPSRDARCEAGGEKTLVRRSGTDGVPSRRRLLSSTTALVSTLGLAGCSADTGLLGSPTDTPTETPVPYPHLHREPLHVGPAFDLEFPPGVTLVGSPAEATVTLLASDTTVPPDEVVAWLEAGHPVAVLGYSAVETMGRLLEEGAADPPGDGSYIGTGGDDPSVVCCIVPAPDDWDTVTGFTGSRDSRARDERLRDAEYVVESVASRASRG
jgi:hypothetical protein